MNRALNTVTVVAGPTLSLENARRFPLAPLALRMGVVLLVDGEEGGQQPGQALEGRSEIAARLCVSERTVRRWLGPPDRWGHRPGLSWAQADRYAVAAGFMPWQVWPDWSEDGPGEEDLFDRRCRCRPEHRRPMGGECDRCGGRVPLTLGAAA